MPSFDTTAPQETTDKKFSLFETGNYPMEIVAAKVAPSRFADDDGNVKDELTITYVLDPETPDQADEFRALGYETEKGWMRQWDHMPPWYGTGKRGPSKLKSRVDPFIERGLIPPQFDIAEGDQPEDEGDLIHLKCNVMIEKYILSMGPNKGNWGNRVLAITPRGKAKPPTPTVPAPPAIPRRTAVTTTNSTPAAPKVIPPAKYFDDMLAEADDPALPMDQLIEIDAEFRRYAGGFWTTKERATDPDELRNQLRRMLGMITRNRGEAQPEEDLAF
jgi:hypothetical protein